MNGTSGAPSADNSWKQRVESGDIRAVEEIVNKLKTLCVTSYSGWKLNADDTSYLVEVFFGDGWNMLMDDVDSALWPLRERVIETRFQLIGTKSVSFPGKVSVGVAIKRISALIDEKNKEEARRKWTGGSGSRTKRKRVDN
jgi:hypothetical protein